MMSLSDLLLLDRDFVTSENVDEVWLGTKVKLEQLERAVHVCCPSSEDCTGMQSDETLRTRVGY